MGLFFPCILYWMLRVVDWNEMTSFNCHSVLQLKFFNSSIQLLLFINVSVISSLMTNPYPKLSIIMGLNSK